MHCSNLSTFILAIIISEINFIVFYFEFISQLLTAVPITVIDVPLFLVVAFLSVILYNLRNKGKLSKLYL